MDRYKKVGLGALGVTGASLLAVRTMCPWIRHDLALIRSIRKMPNSEKDIKNNIYTIDVFEMHARNQPGKTFIIFEDQFWSYAQVDEMANRVANLASTWALEPVDVVSMMIHNGPAFIWTYLGLRKLGIPVSFINFNLKAESLAKCIEATESKILIVGEGSDLLRAVVDIKPYLTDVTVYIQGEICDAAEEGFIPFNHLLSASPTMPIPRSVRAGMDQFAVDCYIFTSGTTGVPKAAPILNYRVRLTSKVMYLFDYNNSDIMYMTLPLYHSAGHQVGLTCTIELGATIVLRRKFSAQAFWEDCRKYKVTVFQYIGEMCRYLLAQPEHPDDGQHNIKFGVGNGLRIDIWDKFIKRFKLPKVYEIFAATEGFNAFININMKPGAIGRLSPLTNLFDPAPRVLVKYDPITFQPVRNKHGRCIKIKPGESGLLLGKYKPGIPVTPYRDKKQSEKKLVRNMFVQGDVYFNYADILFLDSEYFVFFNDRTGDTFRWKGENVSTMEVAEIITSLEFIDDATVYGVTIPGADGKAGMASIQIRGNHPLSTEMCKEIYKHCQKKLPSYATPLFLRVRETIEVTATFKHNKMKLVKDGFNPHVVSDPLFYIDHFKKSYQLLDNAYYENMMAIQAKL